LKDLANDPVAGHFYRSQLLPAPPPEKGTYFRVEKVIKTKKINKKKWCLVKYLHYPAVSLHFLFFIDTSKITKHPFRNSTSGSLKKIFSRNEA
jgi:hypothetical protein